MKKLFTLNGLRLLSLEVLWLGASISIVIMFRAGRNNDLVLLKMLFLVWVASPFIALTAAHYFSKGWSGISIKTLCILMLVIALGSLASYSGIFIMPGSKPAFIFLLVPLVSWLLMVVIMPIIYRKRKD
jgi:hypothetical protein